MSAAKERQTALTICCQITLSAKLHQKDGLNISVPEVGGQLLESSHVERTCG